MSKPIRRVGVIGAGVMGSGIAAHLANAGVSVVLLDIVPPALPNGTEAEKKDPRARNRFSAGGLEKALKAKPAFRRCSVSKSITSGSSSMIRILVLNMAARMFSASLQTRAPLVKEGHTIVTIIRLR